MENSDNICGLDNEDKTHSKREKSHKHPTDIGKDPEALAVNYT